MATALDAEILQANPIALDPEQTDLDQFATLVAFESLFKRTIGLDFETLSKDHVDTNDLDKQGLPTRSKSKDPLADSAQIKVGIVGAGIAGLWAATILQQLGIQYEIYEASERVGGRILTHYFSDRSKARETHDYYDIGAMRFPNTRLMKNTFKLFELIGFTSDNKSLLPYLMESATQQPFRYNDITTYRQNSKHTAKLNGTASNSLKRKADALDDDPYHVSIKNGGCVPNDSVANAQAILNDAYDYYRARIKRDPVQGFKYLMRHDKFSLRDYLAFVEDYDRATIDWLETLNSATGWFDMAFTGNVLEELAFDYGHNENATTTNDPNTSNPNAEVKWWCVNGGTEKIVEALVEQNHVDSSHIHLHHQVKAMSQDAKTKQITIEYTDSKNAPEKTEKKAFDAVINTTTLGAMQRMDLSGLKLPYAYKQAIRSLRYDTSTKVGMKFKEPWWINDANINIRGGLGKTDLPLRVCVYPSYNIDDFTQNPHKEAVLLCSYSWGQDSERLGCMVRDNSPQDEGMLRDLLLDNLARLHTTNDEDYKKLLTRITSLYMTHHAYDWSKNPHSAGAFALFAPGQFQELYGTLVHPTCDSRFNIAGEAVSANHAWIAGSLDSAMRGVYNVLERFRLDAEMKRMHDRFGSSVEIDYQRAHLSVAIGMDREKKIAVRKP